MSRIGKKPILIPEGVEIIVKEKLLEVIGKLGSLSFSIVGDCSLQCSESEVRVISNSIDKKNSAFYGLNRAIISNMVVGVSQGFSKELSIKGVGYRFQVSGSRIIFSLGFSHPVEKEIPDGLSAFLDDKTKNLVIKGIDKQKVGQFAADIRFLRPPEPYKGKGIRYVDEYVPIKAGKTASK